jgi:hypothetical protein
MSTDPRNAGEVKTWYVDRVREVAERTCRQCGRPLDWVDAVGWVDIAGGTYDICEGDRYGNHQPELASET